MVLHMVFEALIGHHMHCSAPAEIWIITAPLVESHNIHRISPPFEGMKTLPDGLVLEPREHHNSRRMECLFCDLIQDLRE